MKKTVLLFTFLAVIVTKASSQISHADTAKAGIPKNEIRLNLSFFLSLFRNQPESTSATSFSLSGNRFISQKTFLRIDVGFGYNDNTSKIDTTPYTKTYTDVEQSYGIGVGKEIKISKRFSFYYGGEAELQTSYTKTIQPGNTISIAGIGTQTITNYNVNYGACAFMGIKLYLFRRISLSTDTKVDFLFVNSINNTVYDMTPNQTTRSTTKGFNTTYYLPSTIFMNIRLGK